MNCGMQWTGISVFPRTDATVRRVPEAALVFILGERGGWVALE